MGGVRAGEWFSLEVPGSKCTHTHAHTGAHVYTARLCAGVRVCELPHPMDCSLPGIFQARVLEWVAISFSTRPVTTALESHLPGLPHATLCSGQTTSSAVPKCTLSLSLGTGFLHPTRPSESSFGAFYSLSGLQQGSARAAGGPQRCAGWDT